MSTVSFKVGPKTYTVNTAEGEEDKITALGELIDAKYALLGNARAVQETDNLVFASLFLADELEETRKSIADAKSKADAAEAEAKNARADAEKLREEMDAKIEKAVAKANSNVEHEKAKSGGKKAELKAEIETLRKAEKRAREKGEALKAELAELREASRQQHDLFGADEADESFIEKLEAMAERAEKAADLLEGADTSD